MVLKILDLLNDYYGTKAKTFEEFVKDIKESDDFTMPVHISNFFMYVQRKEDDYRTIRPGYVNEEEK